jgi:GNAT superfamily N-acetyltransferase
MVVGPRVQFGLAAAPQIHVRPHMKFLIDTNVLIPLEPAGADLAPTMPIAAELLALVSTGHHQVLLHPAYRADLARDTDMPRRTRTEALARKYSQLVGAPTIPPDLQGLLGPTAVHSNDWVDDQLLAAVWADAVDYVVTEDLGLHHKARRLGLDQRVATIAEAAAILRGLFDRVPIPPPAVRHVKAAELRLTDPIFASVRDEYGPGFDPWLRTCRLEGRDCWVIESAELAYAALCIIKQERDEHGLEGRVLKLCTFKVADEHRGRHYGELLLKTVFDHCESNGYDGVYVTVFDDRHPTLVNLLEDFGFARLGATAIGEAVMGKSLRPAEADRASLDPLGFHIRFGPPAIWGLTSETYLIPIIPDFHRALFPDAEGRITRSLQLTLAMGPGDQPYGNSLRKAYLSNARRVNIQSGATLLFYRSHDFHAVTVVGVLEASQMSSDADQIVRFVGKRTVYSYDDIAAMCEQGEVLVLLLRQDRILDVPIGLDELVDNGVTEAHPQSLVRAKEEGLPWLAQRIGV